MIQAPDPVTVFRHEAGIEHPQRFVSGRLAAGAEMLRSLWWSAWVESEGLSEERRARGWDK